MIWCLLISLNSMLIGFVLLVLFGVRSDLSVVGVVGGFAGFGLLFLVFCWFCVFGFFLVFGSCGCVSGLLCVFGVSDVG